jgi:protein SCO1
MNIWRSRATCLWLLAFCVALTPVISTGCGGGDTAETFEARPDARRYPLTGVVRAVRPEDRTVSIAHEPIPDLMDAMTMDFVVREAWVLQAASPGDRVSATLVLDGARSWIESVVVTRTDAAGTAAPGAAPGLQPGDRLPEVPLVDQDGRAVTPATYQGRAAVYTFIYTRCPLPDYCPLMVQRLEEVGRDLQAAGRRDDVWLIGVSLDPAFDTPEVLRAYGERSIQAADPGARFARWALLTGEPASIRTLAAAFLLTYETAGDEIIHGLRTVVVDEDGQVLAVFRGNDWTADQVTRALPAPPAGARDR